MQETLQPVLLSHVSNFSQQCEQPVSNQMTQTSMDDEQRVMYCCDEFEFSGFETPAPEAKKGICQISYLPLENIKLQVP